MATEALARPLSRSLARPEAPVLIEHFITDILELLARAVVDDVRRPAALVQLPTAPFHLSDLITGEKVRGGEIFHPASHYLR